METSQLPPYPPDSMANMDHDPPYVGLQSVPGVLPVDFWVNFPSHIPAYFSTRLGTFPVRYIPPHPPCTVVRSNFNADIFYMAEKYTEQFPEVVAGIEALPTRWEDLYEYFDPMDLYVEGAGFLYRVIHRIVWHSLMKRRRLARHVENWCMQNIPKLAKLPHTGSPVKKLLDASDWHYFNFSNIPELEMNMICGMLDRQTFDMRPMIERYKVNSAPPPNSVISQSSDHQPQGPEMQNGPSTFCPLRGGEAHQSLRPSNPGYQTHAGPPTPSNGRGHRVHEAFPPALRRDISQGGNEQGGHQQSQPHSMSGPQGPSNTNVALNGHQVPRQNIPTRPLHMAQRNSSGYSATETLAELKDETESPVPRVALPGQPQPAQAPLQPEEAFDVSKLYNASVDWTVAASENRLVGIRIADAYDTATILESDMIPKVMGACGEVESYRPQISDARLTFVSPVSAQEALRFNGKSVENGPSLIVYLIPNWDNAPEPENASENGIGGGHVPSPHNIEFRPQPFGRPRVNTGASWASAAVFTPQGSAGYGKPPAPWPPRQARPPAQRPSPGPKMQVAKLSTPRVPYTPLGRPAAQLGPVMYGYVGHPVAQQMGFRHGSFPPPKDSKTTVPGSYPQLSPQQNGFRTASQSSTMAGGKDATAVLYNAKYDCQVLVDGQGRFIGPLPKTENVTASGSSLGNETQAEKKDKGTGVSEIQLDTNTFNSTVARDSQELATAVDAPQHVKQAVVTDLLDTPTPAAKREKDKSTRLSMSSTLPFSQAASAQQSVDNKTAKDFNSVYNNSNDKSATNKEADTDAANPIKSFGRAKKSPEMRDPSLSCDARNDPQAARPKRQNSSVGSYNGSQQTGIQAPQPSFHVPPESTRFKRQDSSAGPSHGSQKVSTQIAQGSIKGPPISGSDETEYISVRRGVVPWIVGLRGFRVRKLKAESGCGIDFMDPHGSSLMQECCLKGPTPARAYARAMIHRLVDDADANAYAREWPESFFLHSSIADLVNRRHRTNVAHIEALTGTAIKLDTEDEPGMPIRRCLITGTKLQRLLALEQIECITDSIRMERSNGELGIQSFHVDFGADRRIRYDPRYDIRYKMNGIQDRTECRIYVLLSDVQHPPTQLCQIIGPHAKLADAREQLKAMISSINGNGPRQPNFGSDMFTISQTAVTRVVGRNGSNIRSLEGQSGCKVDIQPHMDPELSLHQVTVTGPDHSRPEIVTKIRRLAAESRMQASESSNDNVEGLRRLLESVATPLTETAGPPKNEHSKSKLSKSSKGDEESIRRILKGVTTPPTEIAGLPKGEQTPKRSNGNEEGIHRLVESVTAPHTETAGVPKGDPAKIELSIHVEEVEYVPAVVKVSRQESKSVFDDIEISGEDIRSSAAYVKNAAGGDDSLAAAAKATPRDFIILKAQAKKPADAVKKSKAPKHTLEGDSTIFAASTETSGKGKKPSTFMGKKVTEDLKRSKAPTLTGQTSTFYLPSTTNNLSFRGNVKRTADDTERSNSISLASSLSFKGHAKRDVEDMDHFKLAMDTPEQDSRMFSTSAEAFTKGYKGPASAKRISKDTKRPKIPATMVREDSTLSLASVGDEASSKALSKDYTDTTKRLQTSKMSRQDSTLSMASAGSSVEGDKGPNFHAKKSLDAYKYFRDATDVPEGDSTISMASTTDPAQGTTGPLIQSKKSAADIKKAAAKATQKSSGKKSTSAISLKENQKEVRGRRLEADVVSVLDNPMEWPLLSGRPAAQSFGGQSLSPMANKRIPSGRRDSMAAIAGRAKPRVMSDAGPTLPMMNREPKIEYVDHGLRVASNSTVNSDVTVVPAKGGVGTKAWPTVVEWNGKKIAMKSDWEVETHSEHNDSQQSSSERLKDSRKKPQKVPVKGVGGGVVDGSVFLSFGPGE